MTKTTGLPTVSADNTKKPGRINMGEDSLLVSTMEANTMNVISSPPLTASKSALRRQTSHNSSTGRKLDKKDSTRQIRALLSPGLKQEQSPLATPTRKLSMASELDKTLARLMHVQMELDEAKSYDPELPQKDVLVNEVKRILTGIPEDAERSTENTEKSPNASNMIEKLSSLEKELDDFRGVAENDNKQTDAEKQELIKKLQSDLESTKRDRQMLKEELEKYRAMNVESIKAENQQIIIALDDMVQQVEIEKETVKKLQDELAKSRAAQGEKVKDLSSQLSKAQETHLETVKEKEDVLVKIAQLNGVHSTALQQKESQYKKDMQSLRTENEFLKEDLKALQEEYDNQKKSVEKLNSQLNLSLQDNRSLLSQMSEFKRVQNELIKNHMDEMKGLSLKYDEALGRIQDLSDKQKETEHMQSELQNLTQRNLKLEEDYKNALVKAGDANSELKLKTAQIDMMKKDMEERLNSVYELHFDKKRSLVEIMSDPTISTEDLMNKVASIDSSFKKKARRVSNPSMNLEAVAEMEEENKALQDTIAAMENSLTEVLEECDALRSKNEELTTSFADLHMKTADYEELSIQLDTLKIALSRSPSEQEVIKLKAELETLKEEFDSLKEQLKDSTTANSALAGTNDKLTGQIAELQENLDKSNSRVEELQKKIDGLLNEVKGKDSCIADLNQDFSEEVQRLQNEIQALESKVRMSSETSCPSLEKAPSNSSDLDTQSKGFSTSLSLEMDELKKMAEHEDEYFSPLELFTDEETKVQLKNKETECAQLTEKLGQMEKKLNMTLKEREDVLSSCAEELTNEMSLRKELTARVEELSKDLMEARDEASKFSEKAERLSKEFELEKKIKDDLVEEKKKLEERIIQLETSLAAAEKTASDQDNSATLEIEQLQIKLEELTATISDKNKAMTLLKVELQEQESLKAKMEDLNTKLENMTSDFQNSEQTMRQELDQKEQQLEEALSQLEDLYKQLEQKDSAIKDLQTKAQANSPKSQNGDCQLLEEKIRLLENLVRQKDKALALSDEKMMADILEISMQAKEARNEYETKIKQQKLEIEELRRKFRDI